MTAPTLHVVEPDVDELWRRVVTANGVFVEDASTQTADALVAAFDLFADAFCKNPVVAAGIKADVRKRVRNLLESAA